jgi:hypothetical protein
VLAGYKRAAPAGGARPAARGKAARRASRKAAARSKTAGLAVAQPRQGRAQRTAAAQAPWRVSAKREQSP